MTAGQLRHTCACDIRPLTTALVRRGLCDARAAVSIVDAVTGGDDERHLTAEEYAVALAMTSLRGGAPSHTVALAQLDAQCALFARDHAQLRAALAAGTTLPRAAIDVHAQRETELFRQLAAYL